MKWLVQLTKTDSGDPVDGEYADGIVIEDRRESTHDLVQKANEEWGSSALDGEHYSITPIIPTRNAVVRRTEDGFTIEHY